MTPAIAEQTLQFVGLASALANGALTELQTHRTGQEKAAALRTPVLDKLTQAGCVSANQKDAALTKLASHAGTLELLSNAAEVISRLQTQATEKRAGDLGEGVADDKRSGVSGHAAYNSMTDGYVGKKTSEKKASDLAIMAVLN